MNKKREFDFKRHKEEVEAEELEHFDRGFYWDIKGQDYPYSSPLGGECSTTQGTANKKDT